MNQVCQKSIKSQQLSSKKVPRRKKTERVRVSNAGGMPIYPIPKVKIAERPVAHIKRYAPNIRRVLNFLCDKCKSQRFVYYSQSTIAKSLDVSRATVNRALGVLVEDGLVSSNYRHMKTCVYKVATFLWKKKLSKRLSKLLPALLSVFLLSGVTQIKNINSYNKKTLDVLSSNSVRSVPKKTSLDFNARRGKIVAEDPRKIASAVNEIAEIVNLTLLGKCWFAVFPSAVLREAKDTLTGLMRRRIKIPNPFGLLYKRCLNLCSEQQIQPNWKVFKALKLKHCLNDRGDVTITNELNWTEPQKKQAPKIERPSYGAYRIHGTPKPEPIPIAQQIAALKRKRANDKGIYRFY